MFRVKSTHSSTYVHLRAAASSLGMPVAWLKREADTGRLPCIWAGKRPMFDLAAVLKVLAERQTKGGAE